MLRSTLVAAALIFASTTFACEPECRHGLARDFTTFYRPVMELSMSDLHKRLTATTMKPVAIAEQLSAIVMEETIREDVRNSINNSLENFVNTASGKTLESGIFKVMFAEENPFKGDCNHPKRLERNMPPPGESWRRDECEKMDYICGNPPAICHFLSDIKERIVGRMRDQLKDHARYQQGLLFREIAQGYRQSVYNTLVRYGAGSMANDPSVMDYINVQVDYGKSALNDWINEDLPRLCKLPEHNEICNGWDEKIIPEILKWP
ncbi:hypothetical protein BDF14DRAFT_1752734 [Spinellus fusiger]|nr:hypothetical protein BDF14DRAFT_1752734 [Spinellus fusiger]